MRWERVCVEAIAYELPDQIVQSDVLEARLAPLYRRFHLGAGQVQALTGIRERRVWDDAPELSRRAAAAARKAMAQAGLAPEDVGALIYGSVNRENLEPATACPVADQLGIRGDALVMDVANACLGVLNGMAIVADMIELGRIRAGIVVAAETSREIVDDTIERMLRDASMETFRLCIASLTGGSGAVAVVLMDSRDSVTGRRLVGGASLSAPEHHRIARWGPSEGLLGRSPWVMETDATAVLKHGVALGKRTFAKLLATLDWTADDLDKTICHQVGSGHRSQVLSAMGIPKHKDFITYETLGNIGPVSLPLTAAMADEQGFFDPGDRVGFLGIGTGLNCFMMGLEW